MIQELYTAMAQSVIDGEAESAKQLAQQVLQQDLDPLDAIQLGYVQGVNQVGQAFGCGEAFIPDLVMAGKAIQAALEILEPAMAQHGAARQKTGTVVIGTVQGDIHEIGKSLVGTMLTMNGFEVHDLGVNVPADVFVEKVQQTGADILGLSALLTTTMAKQGEVIQALEAARIRQDVKIIVGGAPVSESWSAKIGADGYGEDAMDAVEVAKQLMTRSSP